MESRSCCRRRRVCRACARFPRPRQFDERSIGFVGVSIQIIRVFGRSAAAAAAGCDRSTNVKIERGRAPSHALEEAKAAAVEVIHREHVIAAVEELEQRAVAAMPEAKASQRVPPSRSAMQRSQPCASGFCVRDIVALVPRPGSPAHRSTRHRSGHDRTRGPGPATGPRGSRGRESKLFFRCPSSMPQFAGCAVIGGAGS